MQKNTALLFNLFFTWILQHVPDILNGKQHVVVLPAHRIMVPLPVKNARAAGESRF